MLLYTVAVEYNQALKRYYHGINYHVKIMVHLGIFCIISTDCHIIK